MVYITLEQRKIQKEKQIKFLENVFEDLKSNKPDSEKKYLHKMLKLNEKLMSKQNCSNYDGQCGNEFFTNYHNSNGVCISGLVNSNYVGNSSPSLF